MRNPVAAGGFYPDDSGKLRDEIKKCFLGEHGPGKLPVHENKNLVGVIAPHAGYLYSGQCAAWSYLEIPKEAVFIILGTDHSGCGTFASDEDWKTPLGAVKSDRALVKILEKNGIVVNNSAHQQEHSIEVQLPFLQYVCKSLSIVAINVSHDTDYEELAEIIFKSIEEYKKRVIIIASGDFTHYGENYGYVPFRANVKENLTKLDEKAIGFILKLDAEGFLNYVEKTGATICGSTGFSVFIELCRRIGAKKTTLKKYYSSGEISHDYSNAVGYAAITAER